MSGAQGSGCYPIDRLTDGDGGQLGWWAKGHYPSEPFAQAVERFADEWNAWPDWRDDAPTIERVRIPVQSVYRTWWRCIPVNDPDHPGFHEYRVAKPRSRGAFAVTVTEHTPWAGFDGQHRRSRRGCGCRACGSSQRSYAEGRRLHERRERVEQWRAAAHPDRYRHDVVLHDGSNRTWPCLYLRWDDLDAPHVRAFVDRVGCAMPTRPEVMQHAA